MSLAVSASRNDAEDPVAGGGVRAEGNQVVVVEGDAPGAEGGELLDRLDRVEGGAGGVTELVAALPADGPQAEGEVVGAGGGGGHGGHPCRGLGGGRSPVRLGDQFVSPLNIYSVRSRVKT